MKSGCSNVCVYVCGHLPGNQSNKATHAQSNLELPIPQVRFVPAGWDNSMLEVYKDV